MLIAAFLAFPALSPYLRVQPGTSKASRAPMDTIWHLLFRYGPVVTSVAGAVAAAMVTVHILLTKRDVTAAVAWIGLSWLVPVFGPIVYLVLGINRVRRRARKRRPQDPRPDRAYPDERPRVDGALAPLARSIGRVTDRPLLDVTVTRALYNGDQAYPAMLDAIAAARRSIGLSSYIFRDDQWGRRFIDALEAAKRRGVDVRVLIDGVGSGWLRSPAYEDMRGRGIRAARFMHSMWPWRMPFLNLRSHKKILVIDGSLGFTGGMNIAAQNVMAEKPEEPVQDMHFQISGPVVAQLTEAFAADWSFETDEDLAGEAWFPAIPPGGKTVARVIDAGPDQDLEKIEVAILQAIASATASIAVMTPYFLPDERLISALSRAAMRGVSVDVIHPGKSDNRMVDWATLANDEPLVRDGVRIWLSPPPFHHHKLMVVDGAWCLIGSSNWDIRSFRLNFELSMEVYDRDLAAELTEFMHANRQRPLSANELDARPLAIRLRDAAARLLLPYL